MSDVELSRLTQAVRGAPGSDAAATEGQNICGDIDMRVARDGTWFYHGSPIGRKPLVKLFASVLQRDGTGDYWLVTLAERCRITVEDAPFTAVEMFVEGEGRARRLSFRTNVDDMVTADREHPIRVATDVETGEPSPYLRVRDGLEALIVRAVFYDLVELGEDEEREEGTVYGVWSGGEFFALGRTDDG